MNRSGDDDRGRAFEMTLEIGASPQAVWRALTDADELVRWFPLEARVAPGEGGAMWWGWEDPWFFDTGIEVWRPQRQLRLVERRTDGTARDRTLAMDFVIEGRGGTTVLRFVHSGFGSGSDWDDEFDGISRGWAFELRSLRHYLEHHLGRPRQLAWVRRETALEPGEAAARLLGASALLAEGTIAGLGEGEPYTMRTAEGERFDGTVLVHQPPRHFAGVVPGLDHGLIRYEIEGPFTVLMLALWGDRAAEARAFEERWSRRLAELL
jgi:uncharacterized protein YndB with AHSA1/START domain